MTVGTKSKYKITTKVLNAIEKDLTGKCASKNIINDTMYYLSRACSNILDDYRCTNKKYEHELKGATPKEKVITDESKSLEKAKKQTPTSTTLSDGSKNDNIDSPSTENAPTSNMSAVTASTMHTLSKSQAAAIEEEIIIDDPDDCFLDLTEENADEAQVKKTEDNNKDKKLNPKISKLSQNLTPFDKAKSTLLEICKKHASKYDTGKTPQYMCETMTGLEDDLSYDEFKSLQTIFNDDKRCLDPKHGALIEGYSLRECGVRAIAVSIAGIKHDKSLSDDECLKVKDNMIKLVHNKVCGCDKMYNKCTSTAGYQYFSSVEYKKIIEDGIEKPIIDKEQCIYMNTPEYFMKAEQVVRVVEATQRNLVILTKNNNKWEIHYIFAQPGKTYKDMTLNNTGILRLKYSHYTVANAVSMPQSYIHAQKTLLSDLDEYKHIPSEKKD